MIRWTAAGRRGAGGGWVAAAVVAAGEGRGTCGLCTRWRASCSTCRGYSAGHLGCAQRGVPTVQTVQKTVLGVDVPVISSNSSCSPEVRILPQIQFILRVVNIPAVQQISSYSTGAVLGQGGDLPVVVTTGAVIGFWAVVHMPYMCNDRCLALDEFPYFLRDSGLRS